MRVSVVLSLVLFGSSTLAAQASQPPADVATLLAKARLHGDATAWCRAEFRPGQPPGIVVAIASATGGGRYIAIHSTGAATELAAFTRAADLACYSRAEAEKLAVSLRKSDTIHGDLTPRWRSTVICGFVDDTSAECWQYSPDDRSFVTVGRWTT